MSKEYIPIKDKGYLFRGAYRVNKSYSYDYDHLTSLVRWWEYLNHQTYRYTFLILTLNYSDNARHQPDNITKLLKELRRSFKVKDNKVPLHTVWKLEHRPIGDSNKEAVGFHYHVVFAFSRDITQSTTALAELIKKHWKHGKVHISNTVHTPKELERDWKNRPLKHPIKNTQPEHFAALFHHLSYLAKADPKQVLPSEYTGDSFKTSQMLKSRLDAHPSIKKHKNTIAIDVSSLYPEEEEHENILSNDEWGECPF
ncbi:inovirus-type Gp2 protein [Vibrio sp. 1580]|nr:inovirus-type Gp2 protein [Vibrio sp. 1580]MDW2102695.1 inovirus-type Gp2 protein [Vibrio sp. 1580]